MTDVPSEQPISGSLLFYKKPEPLNFDMHKGLGLRRMDKPFGFAHRSQAVPLTVAEFGAAALSYPIIFAGDEHQPLAVMGLVDNTNLFIHADGSFEQGCYVPAYIRRYPFVLARDDVNQQMVVCIDREAPMIGDLPDLAFFDDAGGATDYTNNCIQFCNDYEVEVQRTQAFMQLLNGLDIWETRKATHTPVNPDGSQGATQEVAEFFAVSEEKVKALPDATIRELVDNGALGQIYTHLTSLFGWERLIQTALSRQNTGNITIPIANMN